MLPVPGWDMLADRSMQHVDGISAYTRVQTQARQSLHGVVARVFASVLEPSRVYTLGLERVRHEMRVAYVRCLKHGLSTVSVHEA